MGRILKEMFGVDEMARPRGTLGGPMRAAVEWAKGQREVSYNELFQVWRNAGGAPGQQDDRMARNQFGQNIRRLVAWDWSDDARSQNPNGLALKPSDDRPFVVTNPTRMSQHEPILLRHMDVRGGGKGPAVPMGVRQAASAVGGNKTGRAGRGGHAAGALRQGAINPSPLKAATSASPDAGDFEDEEPTDPGAEAPEERGGLGMPHWSTGEHDVADEPEASLEPDGNEPAGEEPEDGGEDEEEEEWWMPGAEGWADPDSRPQASMEALEKKGVQPTDPVWDEVAAAENSDDARGIMAKHPRYRSGQGQTGVLFADVAKQIFANRDKEWE